MLRLEKLNKDASGLPAQRAPPLKESRPVLRYAVSVRRIFACVLGRLVLACRRRTFREPPVRRPYAFWRGVRQLPVAFRYRGDVSVAPFGDCPLQRLSDHVGKQRANFILWRRAKACREPRRTDVERLVRVIAAHQGDAPTFKRVDQFCGVQTGTLERSHERHRSVSMLVLAEQRPPVVEFDPLAQSEHAGVGRAIESYAARDPSAILLGAYQLAQDFIFFEVLGKDVPP